MPHVTLNLTDAQFELLLKLITPKQIEVTGVDHLDILDTPLLCENFSTMPQWIEFTLRRTLFRTLRDLLSCEEELIKLNGVGHIKAQKIKDWVESLGVKFERLKPRF